jgi:homoserine kinase
MIDRVTYNVVLAAARKAVEVGLLPKEVPAEDYMRNIHRIAAVVVAAINEHEKSWDDPP